MSYPSHGILSVAKQILAEYADSLGLPKDVHYYGGARLRPVVPLDAAIGEVMIVGAYPSARFETVEGKQNVPVADNLGPFEPERFCGALTTRKPGTPSSAVSPPR